MPTSLTYRFERDETSANRSRETPARDALAAVEECRRAPGAGGLEIVQTDPAGAWVDVRIELPADSEPQQLAEGWRDALSRHGLNAVYLGA